MRKLYLITAAAATLIVFFSATGCKKTTNNTTVVKDSIYYSSWVPLSMKFDGTDSVYYQDFNNSKLTAGILRSGVVLGYFGAVGTSKDTTIASTSEFDYLGVTEQVQVGLLDLSAFVDLSYSKGGFLYRYVIIPGNVLANTSLKGMTHEQLSKMKWTDIQQAIKRSGDASTGQGNTFH